MTPNGVDFSFLFFLVSLRHGILSVTMLTVCAKGCVRGLL